MLIWVSQWSQCFKTPVAQHWGGRRQISVGKTVWSRNLRGFPENSRETVSVSTICDEYCLCVWRAWTGNVTVNNFIRSTPKRIDMVIRNEEKRIRILKKYDYRISILWITAWDFFSQNVNFQRQWLLSHYTPKIRGEGWCCIFQTKGGENCSDGHQDDV